MGWGLILDEITQVEEDTEWKGYLPRKNNETHLLEQGH